MKNQLGLSMQLRANKEITDYLDSKIKKRKKDLTMNIPKEIILDVIQEIHTSFNIKLNQLDITDCGNYMRGVWRDEYGYKEKLKIVYDEDFKRPDLVISNQQFSYNNKLYQLLVIDQPRF